MTAKPNGYSSFLFGKNQGILWLYIGRKLQRSFCSGIQFGKFKKAGSFKTQNRRMSRNTDWSYRHLIQNPISLHNDKSVYKHGLSKDLSRLFRTQQFRINDLHLRTFVKTRHLHREEPWMISDDEVISLIKKCETSAAINRGIIDRFETNHLASNQPIEDRKFVVKLHHEEGHLFGVLDGHGGDSCAHSVCQRIPDYIGLALLPPDILMASSNDIPEVREYLVMTNCDNGSYNYMNDPISRQSLYYFFKKLREKYNSKRSRKGKSLKPRSSRGLFTSLAECHEEQMSLKTIALTNAFLQLDEDISAEALALDEVGQVKQHAFAAANAGACTLVAHINGTELCIANTGDCRAVLGVENADNTWSAIQLSSDHTAGNPGEVQRIISQHPKEEATTCIQYERLLSRLAPLRAFGDVRFKWDSKTQEKMYSNSCIRHLTEAEHLHTPPYLTAEPEVTSYQLQRSDKFLVLATDGLWDMLSNKEVVHFVKEHNDKKKNTQVENLTMKAPSNEQDLHLNMLNSASCLIHEALGGEHVSVSTSLSIPYPDVRMYRDDITIIVIYFDWDQLEIPNESDI